MSEMVDRVARAMAERAQVSSRFRWPDQDHSDWQDLARAAIGAMREPTKDMVAALDGHPYVRLALGDSYASREDHQKEARKRLIDAHQLMIDEALK